LQAEHEELMPQHQKLDVFGEPAASPSEEQLQDRRESEIGEGKEHSTMFPEPIAGRSKTGTHALKPSRSQLRSPGPI
jgi:hypothetical protein